MTQNNEEKNYYLIEDVERIIDTSIRCILMRTTGHTENPSVSSDGNDDAENENIEKFIADIQNIVKNSLKTKKISGTFSHRDESDFVSQEIIHNHDDI